MICKLNYFFPDKIEEIEYGDALTSAGIILSYWNFF